MQRRVVVNSLVSDTEAAQGKKQKESSPVVGLLLYIPSLLIEVSLSVFFPFQVYPKAPVKKWGFPFSWQQIRVNFVFLRAAVTS